LYNKNTSNRIETNSNGSFLTYRHWIVDFVNHMRSEQHGRKSSHAKFDELRLHLHASDQTRNSAKSINRLKKLLTYSLD